MPLSPPGPAATILAIDDQEDNLALLDAFLGTKGYEVLTAPDGPRGLALAKERAPALILLDLAMPGMDGFEVLGRLRDDRATAGIPVIILTANLREPAMVERGLALGATEYLTKPIRMEELEVRLRSALRLAAAEREVERLRRDFASMLVHDMRAPLDGIRLALGVLRRQEEPGTPRRSLMDDAYGAVDELGALVDDLLQASRLEEEGFRPESRPTALGPLLERGAALARPLAQARGLALAAEIPADLPAVVADPALTKRVVDNLLGNAVKFTPEGAVSLAARAEPGLVRVEVRDSGPGVPDELKGRVFDRYFHLERRKEGREGGFGLGLAFCERAVTAMGGEIGIADAEGGGAAFWFTVPTAPGA
jgi:signal transduction histidine kinase